MAANYPSAAEVVARLAFMGVTLTTADVAPFLSGVIARWEDLTYSPFKADASPTADVVLEPGGAQERSLPTAFTAITAVKVAGATIASDQYRLLPRSGPFTRIEFAYPVMENMSTVTVTGTKGYSATIPDDVYEAIMGVAVAKVREAQNSGAGPVSKVKQDTVEYTYDTGQGRSKLDAAVAELERLALRYGPTI